VASQTRCEARRRAYDSVEAMEWRLELGGGGGGARVWSVGGELKSVVVAARAWDGGGGV
jgi:hypothetical protein